MNSDPESPTPGEPPSAMQAIGPWVVIRGRQYGRRTAEISSATLCGLSIASSFDFCEMSDVFMLHSLVMISVRCFRVEATLSTRGGGASSQNPDSATAGPRRAAAADQTAGFPRPSVDRRIGATLYPRHQESFGLSPSRARTHHAETVASAGSVRHELEFPAAANRQRRPWPKA